MLAALPEPVRRHARALPVVFEMKPLPSDRKAGIAEDTLGLFSGPALNDSLDMNSDGPSQITLYMENLWDYARHDAPTFREEIRRTYLHELGHYLGFDEQALADRDLD